MPKLESLRALVNERLTAAAEEIFVLFETTIAEYEEELCRSKKENQRKRRLVDEENPRVLRTRARLQNPSLSPLPNVTQETQTADVKKEPEEQSVKQEQEQLLIFAQESSTVTMKTEQPFLLQQIYSEETQDEDISSVGAGVQDLSSPSPGLNQETTLQTAEIKEEAEGHSVQQDEEHLLMFVPELSTVCVKRKEFSLLQQRHDEHRDETQEENISSEPHFHSDTEGDTDHSSDTSDDDSSSTDSDDCSSTDSDDCSSTGSDDDKECPVSCSDAPMETEADGDHYNQVQIRDRSSAARNSGLSPEHTFALETLYTLNNEEIPGRNEAERKKHQCPVCKKRFRNKCALQLHSRVHTSECCTLCEKKNVRKKCEEKYRKTDTSEKPLVCSFCKKTFSNMSYLKTHMRTHSGEKPYNCSLCKKTFTQKSNLNEHMKLHTGEKPYNCPFCNKGFTKNWNLKSHMRVHLVINQS